MAATPLTNFSRFEFVPQAKSVEAIDVATKCDEDTNHKKVSMAKCFEDINRKKVSIGKHGH